VPLGEHVERLRSLLAALKLPATATRVLVVPDADLAYIPFAALWPERDVGLLPCGSLLERLRPFISRRSGTRALAVAVSDYSAPSLLAVDNTLLAKLTLNRVRGGPMNLLPLRFAEQEARHVAGSDGLLLLDSEVTSARLLDILGRPEAPVWTTIHFTCHGLVNADHPRLSGLALTDGLLTAQEIFPLRLKTDMVVLSACDTATDPYVMGEGLSGLVRSFLQAGAPRVIASLWKVPDEPTAALMAHFYDQLRADPELSPSTALRRAQAKIRETWPSPENWAAWTLWGAP
jgi:CHAT domain-containing protein